MADLEFSTENHVATILLNRPERKNAFTIAMIDDWVAAIEQAKDDDEVNVVVLRGAGDAFCAGVDLGRADDEFGATALGYKEALRRRVQRIPLALQSMDKPMIASISGAAFGAGLDMALMCDIRLAARSAVLCESYVRLGLLPGAGGMYFLPRIVGTAKAFEMFATGDRYGADAALEMGLVTSVYDDDALLDEAYALAARLAAVPRVTMGMLKRTFYQSVESSLATSLELVSSQMGIVRSTSESVDAFSARRDAVVNHAPTD
jgi:enoyl-CoA hydratase/carnithine racemase